MASDGLSLLTVLYGRHSERECSDGDGGARNNVAVTRSVKCSEDKPATSTGGGIGVGSGGRGSKDEAAAVATVDNNIVRALSLSCHPSFVKKSFMLCKSVFTS